MPGAFDYSKWDNIDTSSSDDEQDAPSSTDAMQALYDYAFAHGMDEELVADTLAQCGGDPKAAVEYLIDFLEMDTVSVSSSRAPESVAAPARAPAPADGKASSQPLSATARSETSGVASLSTWELQEEMAAGLRHIQELQQKRDGNSSALNALTHLEAERAPHQRSDKRANRQWVNMGDLFVKLPQRQLQATIVKDQLTIDEETSALSRRHQEYSSELIQRRTFAPSQKMKGR